MKKAEIEIESISEYLKHLSTFTCSPDTRYFYRGVSNEQFKLIPSISRKEALGYLQSEKDIFNKFKNDALPFIENRPESELEWLILAQHHGVPTRLLDWTFNPLVALYFAVKNIKQNGLVFMKKNKSPLNWQDLYRKSPFSGEKTKRDQLFRIPHISSNISAQSALLAIHNDPKAESTNILMGIRIKSEYKESILRELVSLGIHEASLFPSLDGVVRHLNNMRELHVKTVMNESITPTTTSNKFNDWNKEKQSLQFSKSRPVYPKPREIWFTKTGVNLGFEENGKKDFLRPVLVIKKVGNLLFTVSLTSKGKDNHKFYHKINSAIFNAQNQKNADNSYVILSQVKVMDKKRFTENMGRLSTEELINIKEKLRIILF